MALKKKYSPAAQAASVMKAISSAEKSAMQAVSGWGQTTKKAVAASERNLAAATRKAGQLKTRAANALKRAQKAKAKQAKAVANKARKRVQAELASARSTLKTARESHAANKAAHKLYQMVEKGMADGVRAAEKIAAKATRPKRLGRRLRKILS